MSTRLRIHHERLPLDASMYRFHASEGLAELCDVHVEITCSNPDLDLAGLLWTDGSIEVFDAGREAWPEEARYFHGVVEEASYVADLVDSLHLYRLRLRPKLNLLSYQERSRIFPNVSAPNIIRALLAEAKIDCDANIREFPTREYTTQYRETNLNFFRRLCEEIGIAYWIEHELGAHRLRLSDDVNDYTPLPGVSAFAVGEVASGDGIGLCEPLFQVRMECQQTHDRIRLRDTNFLTPERPIEGTKTLGEISNLERYEYPARVFTTTEANQVASDRFLEERQKRYVLRATAGCHRLAPGRLFTISRGRPAMFIRDYLTVGLEHEWESPECSGERGGSAYRVHLRAIPSSVEFRPPRVTPRPRVPGKESAIVTTKGGEEIAVDAHGRIKVHFYWDRELPFDDTSSGWIRVQQQNTERQMMLPRGGWEMSIGYLNGDPDHPIALQKLYNADSVPAYELPSALTRSALKSSSTPGGGGSNEIRFDDTNGAQEFYVHAQRDMQCQVGHDHIEEVGVNASRTVEGASDLVTTGGDETYRVVGTQTWNVTGQANDEIGKSRSVTVASDSWNVQHVREANVGGNAEETISGSMFVLAERTKETFNQAHQEDVAITHTRIVAYGAHMEAVAGNKFETTGGAKITIVDQAMAENIGGGKVLTAGTMELKTGEDLIFNGGKKLHYVATTGTFDVTCTEDFTLTGDTIDIRATSTAELLGKGKSLVTLSSSSAAFSGDKMGGDGLKIILKGEVLYKGGQKKKKARWAEKVYVDEDGNHRMDLQDAAQAAEEIYDGSPVLQDLGAAAQNKKLTKQEAEEVFARSQERLAEDGITLKRVSMEEADQLPEAYRPYDGNPGRFDPATETIYIREDAFNDPRMLIRETRHEVGAVLISREVGGKDNIPYCGRYGLTHILDFQGGG